GVRRRAFLSAALAGCGTIALAACGAPTGQPSTSANATPAPSTGASASAPSTAKGKVTFLAQSGKASEDRYKPVIETYQKNKNVTIDAIYGGASATEIQQKLLTMIAGGTPPDVFWTHTYINGGLAKRSVPLDLTALMKGDSSFKVDDYYP